MSDNCKKDSMSQKERDAEYMPYMFPMDDMQDMPPMMQDFSMYPMMDMRESCEKGQPPMPCIPQETVITNVKLATAYVPYQRLCNVFPPDESLQKGTIYPELFSPYPSRDGRYGCGCK